MYKWVAINFRNSYQNYYSGHTCIRFQEGASSAIGSVDTEQSAPINIIWFSVDDEKTRPTRLRIATEGWH